MSNNRLSAENIVGTLQDFARGDWSAATINDTARAAAERIASLEADNERLRANWAKAHEAAEVSECRIAEVYDRIVKARDCVRVHLVDDRNARRAFNYLQEAKYGLGGRTNVAGTIAALSRAALSPAADDGGATQESANAQLWAPSPDLAHALAGLEQLFKRPGESSLDCFERVAAIFYAETGMLAPGKDAPAASHGREMYDAREAYDAWFEAKLEAARAALSPTGEGDQFAKNANEQQAQPAPSVPDKASGGWMPIETAPIGKWLLTYRLGESDWSCALRGHEDEWIAPDGRTTVTHSTYLPPTHYLDVKLPTDKEGGE